LAQQLLLQSAQTCDGLQQRLPDAFMVNALGLLRFNCEQ
jgi:hypothetical protein